LIYLDSSALVKIAVTEAESAALSRWLTERPNLVRVTSRISKVEVTRAVWRANPAAVLQAYQVAERMREVTLSDQVLARAAAMRPPALKSLDAIHLASALALRGNLTAFVSYDKRLLAAAKDASLPVASPA
jgi:predicted nucleic acid-binding protein